MLNAQFRKQVGSDDSDDCHGIAKTNFPHVSQVQSINIPQTIETKSQPIQPFIREQKLENKTSIGVEQQSGFTHKNEVLISAEPGRKFVEYKPFSSIQGKNLNANDFQAEIESHRKFPREYHSLATQKTQKKPFQQTQEESPIYARKRQKTQQYAAQFSTMDTSISSKIPSYNSELVGKSQIWALVDEQISKASDISLSDIAHTQSGALFSQNTLRQNFGHQSTTQEYQPLSFIPSRSQNLPEDLKKMLSCDGNSQPLVKMSKLHPLVFAASGNTLFVWQYADYYCSSSTQWGISESQMIQGREVTGSMEFNNQISALEELACQNGLNNTEKHKENGPGVLTTLMVATQSQLTVITIEQLEHGLSVRQNPKVLSIAIEEGKKINLITEFRKNGRIFYASECGRVSEIQFRKDNNFWHNLSKVSVINIVENKGQKESFFMKLVPEVLKVRFEKQIKQLILDEQRNTLYSLAVVTEGFETGQCIIEVFDLGILGDKFDLILSLKQANIVKKLNDFRGLNEAYGDRNRLGTPDLPWIQTLLPVTYSESKQRHLTIVTKNGERIFLCFSQDAVKDSLDEKAVENAGMQGDLLVFDRIIAGEWKIQDVLLFPADNLVFDKSVNERKLKNGIYNISTLPNTSMQRLPPHFGTIKKCSTKSLLIYDQLDKQEEGIRLCFINKNEGGYAFYKEQIEDYNNFNATLEHTNVQETFTAIQITPSEAQEQVVEIAENQGFGAEKYTPCWGVQKRSQYYPISEAETQVYLGGDKLNVLTNTRLVEISKLRPIDHLIQIVNLLSLSVKRLAQQRRPQQNLSGNHQPTQSILKSKADNLYQYQNDQLGAGFYQNFEDFADSYHLKQVCAMLVQILVDKNSQIDDQYRPVPYLISSKADQAQKDRIKTQNQEKTMQEHQINSHSQMRPFQPILSTKNNRFSESAPLKAQPVDELSLNDFSSQNEVFQLKNIHPDVYSTAFDLLLTYGDTISKNQFTFMMQNNPNEIPTPKLITLKQKAIYTYLGMVLRPIWDLNITRVTDLTKMQEQQCNLQNYLPTLKKLQRLEEFVQANEKSLIGMQLQQNQSNFLQKGNPLSHENVPLFRLQAGVRNTIEMAERTSFTQLLEFISRCIHIISFLKLLNETGTSFQDSIKSLNKDQLSFLADLKLKDFFNHNEGQACDLAQILMEKNIKNQVDVKSGGHAGSLQTSLLIQQKIGQSQTLCSSLFKSEMKHILIGENLLQLASIESNEKRRDELMQKAMLTFAQDPKSIKISNLQPLLLKTGSFTALVWLCIKKIQTTELQQKTEIMELFGTIVALYGALECSLAGSSENQWQKHDYGLQKETFDTYKSHLDRVKDSNQKARLKERITNTIFQQQKHQGGDLLVNHLFKVFLSQGDQSIDFLIQRGLPHELIIENCCEFLNFYKKTLTKGQFQDIERIFLKLQRPIFLGDLVIKVVTDQIILVSKTYDQQSSTSNDKKSEPVYKANQPNMDERLQLIRKTLVMLRDTQGSSAESDSISNIKTELTSIQKTIEHQQFAIRALQRKLEHGQTAQKQNTQTNQTQTSLGWLFDQKVKKARCDIIEPQLELCQVKLMSSMDLIEIFERLNMHECKAYSFLYWVEPSENKQQWESHKQRVIQSLNAHLTDIEAFQAGNSQVQIQDSFLRLFGPDVKPDTNKQASLKIDALQKYFEMTLSSTACVKASDFYNLNSSQTHFWLTKTILTQVEMRPISKLIVKMTRKLQVQTTDDRRFVFSMTILDLIRFWVQSASKTNLVQDKTFLDDLRDFKFNCKDVWMNSIIQVIHAKILDGDTQFPPQESKCLREMLKEVEYEFKSEVGKVCPEVKLPSWQNQLVDSVPLQIPMGQQVILRPQPKENAQPFLAQSQFIFQGGRPFNSFSQRFRQDSKDESMHEVTSRQEEKRRQRESGSLTRMREDQNQ